MWEKLHLPLRLKLLAGFITVILVLSLFHLFSYASLLSSMGRETRRTATERLTSAAARLDASLSQIRNDYFSLTYTAPFRQARTARQVTAYEMVDLREEAQLYFSNTPCIDAFAILFRNSDDVVTSSGNYEAETFFHAIMPTRHTPQSFGRQKMPRFFPSAVTRPPISVRMAPFPTIPATCCRLRSSRSAMEI